MSICEKCGGSGENHYMGEDNPRSCPDCNGTGQVMSDTYTCARCHKTYNKTVSEEEAEKELKETFGNINTSECDLICDDCYYIIMKQ